MVDIQTAMSAARADRGGRRKGAGAGDKKGRSGRDHGIEPFDPVKHVSKERADMFSMWLVIVFSGVVALMMRYVVMPSFDGDSSKDLLWLLPMSLIFVLPSLHRMALPEALHEHYGKGTWFRAAFLHVFTWLAFTFLLTNPPMADIGAPETAAGWTVVMVDGEDLVMTTDDLDSGEQIKFNLSEGQSSLSGEAWLLFGIRDNMDAGAVEVSGTFTLFDGTVLNLTADEDRFDNLSEWGDYLDSGENVSLAWPTLLSHEFDRGMAVMLSMDGLQEGVHVIELVLSEQGDPWKNSRTYTWKVVVSKYVPPSAD